MCTCPQNRLHAVKGASGNATINMDAYTGTNAKELRKSPKGFITLVLSMVVVLGAAYGLTKINNSFQDIKGQNTGDSQVVVTTPTASPNDPNAVIYSSENIANTALQAGDLILVNNDVKYTEGQDTDELVSIYDNKNDAYYVSSIELQLRKRCVVAWNKLMNDFRAATGLDNIQVVTGYRTEEMQQELYNKNKASGNVSKPGYSEHQTGLALNVNLFYSKYSEEFTGEGDYAWVDEHCAEYGFIPRYQASKESETGIGAETGHYRYVGIPHATYMMEQKLCLEEYIRQLYNYTYEGEHLKLQTGDGKQYEVYTVPADLTNTSTSVPVPADLDYTISGNNQDAFIVTVELKDTGSTPVATEPATEESTAPADTPAE